MITLAEMVRLKDLAQEAHVSIRTVSRVINSEPYISQDKIDRVNSAITRLGYTPNLLARGLRTKRTHLLGIIAWNLDPQVITKKLAALQMEAGNTGYQTLFGLSFHDPARERNLIQLYHKICDGIMFLNPPGRDNMDTIAALTIPTIVLGYSSTCLPCINIDRKQGIIEALSLMAVSYPSFVFLTTSQDPREERLVAFNHALEKTGNSGKARVIYTQPNNYDGGYNSGDAISHLRPALLVCYNDQLAFGLMKRLYELSVRVPEEIGVLGFDNDDFTQYSYKALSSVHQSISELAQSAVRHMDRLVEENNTPPPSSGRGTKKKAANGAGGETVLDTIQTHFIARQTTYLSAGRAATSS